MVEYEFNSDIKIPQDVLFKMMCRPSQTQKKCLAVCAECIIDQIVNGHIEFTKEDLSYFKSLFTSLNKGYERYIHFDQIAEVYACQMKNFHIVFFTMGRKRKRFYIQFIEESFYLDKGFSFYVPSQAGFQLMLYIKSSIYEKDFYDYTGFLVKDLDNIRCLLKSENALCEIITNDIKVQYLRGLYDAYRDFYLQTIDQILQSYDISSVIYSKYEKYYRIEDIDDDFDLDFEDDESLLEDI